VIKQKSNGSGNFNPKNKMPSPRYRKPGPKCNSNTNGMPHFPVVTMPNGENPKPVSPAAAGQGFTPPAHANDAKHVQPPVQGDLNAYAVNYPNGRPNTQEQGDHVNHGRHHQRPSVDAPVLVVGTKSSPALSDAQTPKPMNHVENVYVPSVGQVAPIAPSVQVRLFFIVI
jgi:la-related protein 1